MPFILFDPSDRSSLYPLSANKALADFRFGILSIKERWELLLEDEAVVETEEYLMVRYELRDTGYGNNETIDDRLPHRAGQGWTVGVPPVGRNDLRVNAAYIPTTELIEAIGSLKAGEYLVQHGDFVAGRPNDKNLFQIAIEAPATKKIKYPWDIIFLNDAQIRTDFKWVTKGRKSEPISPTVQVLQQADIFIEAGAKLEFCTLNSTTGPIYIGKNAEIMEGTSVRGPFSLGENSVLKLNSRIYGGTSLGPYCMGGGEIKNSVLMGYTNKAHDGYLGDAIIGEWCNMGAGSTNSNLKNSAGDISVWTTGEVPHGVRNDRELVVVGQKCGLIMGDYSRIAINTSINSGSMIGVSCNVFGAGLLPKTINHFSWGVQGEKYKLEKAIQDINNWKKMKGKLLTSAEESVLEHIFQQS